MDSYDKLQFRLCTAKSENRVRIKQLKVQVLNLTPFCFYIQIRLYYSSSDKSTFSAYFKMLLALIKFFVI